MAHRTASRGRTTTAGTGAFPFSATADWPVVTARLPASFVARTFPSKIDREVLSSSTRMKNSVPSTPAFTVAVRTSRFRVTRLKKSAAPLSMSTREVRSSFIPAKVMVLFSSRRRSG